jgi:hypothetical protein
MAMTGQYYRAWYIQSIHNSRIPTLQVILNKFLLPFYWKIIGYILTLAGILCTYFRFGLGIKPAFLEMKVFAIYSSIFETHYFSAVYNNISEEICGILLLTGLILLTFSREKSECEEFWLIRYRSMFLAVFMNAGLLTISFLFVFGWGFLVIMTMNLFSLLVIYNILFHISIYRSYRSSKRL